MQRLKQLEEANNKLKPVLCSVPNDPSIATVVEVLERVCCMADFSGKIRVDQGLELTLKDLDLWRIGAVSCWASRVPVKPRTMSSSNC